MNTLQELNNFGNLPIDYLDNRPSGVIFDREYPLSAVDQDITISSTIIQPQPGINILEVINYQTANVRYRVTLRTGVANPLVGSTISWASLPSGVTLSQVGNQYTLSGINSQAIWEDIKYFTWTLPANYASYPLWYLDVDIIYYNSALAQDVIMNWVVYDDRFFYVAQLESKASINCFGGVNSPASANLSASANISADAFNRVRFDCLMSATANVNCTANVNVTFLEARAAINCFIGVKSPASANLNAFANVSTKLVNLVNKIIDRNYLTNNYTQLFITDTPVLDTTDTFNDIITITLTSNIGRFGTNLIDTPVSSYSLSGTIGEINGYSKLQTIYFFPNKGTNTPGSITWAHRVNGTLLFTKSFNINPITSQWVETIQFLNVGNTTFTPGFVQSYYGGFVDVYLLGGGGCGGQGGYAGGGGGGESKEIFNISITQGTNYTIAVGEGGTQNSSSLINNSGGDSSAFGFTARGGRTGQNQSVNRGFYTGGIGGIDGSNTYIGGTGTSSYNATQAFGGGGAGNGAIGGNATNSSGGRGGVGTMPTIWNSNNQKLGNGGNGGAGVTSPFIPIIQNSGNGGTSGNFNGTINYPQGASGRVVIKVHN